jgi:hypothetical protein
LGAAETRLFNKEARLTDIVLEARVGNRRDVYR